MRINKIKMTGRSFTEGHRAATPLELFFDLIFVIAIASAASNLHHELAAHHTLNGIIAFFMSFFSIWWAWMNFTWFSSAYDTDDTPFRLTTFLLMFGALIFAVGVNDISLGNSRPYVPVFGFVIMRIAMSIHWLRAAKEHPENKKTNLRYAFGIIFAQLCWVAWLFIPKDLALWAFLVFMLIELLVPLYAEGKKLATNWHPHHIAERYGLLTIIVLGEGLLGTANTISGLLKDETHWSVAAFPLGLAAASLIFALWWTYFELPWGRVLEEKRSRKVGFLFGYSHFLVFASLAAVGSSLELIADATQQHIMPNEVTEHPVTPLFAITALSLSIGIYLITTSILRILLIDRSKYNWLALLTSILVAAIPIFMVSLGLEIIWALVFSVIGILIYITFCNWTKCNVYK
ncbi:low temperature requirement protein A [Tamlana flava]|uniref:low temperature requirement protein A n=1 Tax=Tamlana flava TaxID=3158572 RepID=UPI00351AB208